MRALILAAAAVLPLALPLPLAAQEVDIGAIFNCDAGGPLGAQTPEACAATRDVLLNNCTTCHTFVPIVKAQKSEAEWNSLLTAHRERVLHLTEGEFEALGEFLRAHFNETEPVPALPPALEAMSSNQPA
jgi:hypothetical protein